MCGLVGIVATDFVNQAIFDALTALQHRGQDAAGIVTCHQGKLFLRKGSGLVRDVFRQRHMQRLVGNMGIGHVRYPTAGSDSLSEAQPFYVNSPYGITLAHNGTLTNVKALEQDLFHADRRHLNTSSDSEVLLNVFAHELQQFQKMKIDHHDVFHAVRGVHRRCQGAYAAVAMINGYGIVGFRDPYGIRPLVYGVRKSDKKDEYMIASESVALNALGFEGITDVAPGEAIWISASGKLHKQQCADNPTYHPCLFELVYMARPDSVMDGISVYKVRLRLGEHLAEKIKREQPSIDVDVVMPIPDTSRPAALSLAQRLGIKFREGFIKNRYIGRTFIMPGQKQRRHNVRQKLNTMDLEFKNKSVLLVDDSIVRGTTCKEIINMARKAGARKVYFASAAPAVRFPNVYGIDMPCADELIAHDKSVEAVREAIGADGLFYQDLAVLVSAAQEGNASINRFEDSVFTGDYVTGEIDDRYLTTLAQTRNDKLRWPYSSNDQLMLGLHNEVDEE